MPEFNQAMAFSALRIVILSACGWFVHKGLVTADDLTVVATAIAAFLVTAAWALWQRRAKALIATTAALPLVKTIITDPSKSSTTADIVSASAVKVVPR